MNSEKYVFTQLLLFINKYEFEKCVKQYNGDYHVRLCNYSERLRMIEYYDDQRYNTRFIFNNFEISAFDKTPIKELITEIQVNQTIKE